MRYVNSFVQSDPAMGDWSAEDRDVVIKSLSKRAGGMFRWATCQLDTLRRSEPEGISSALEELPAALEETYERALAKIPEEKQKRAHCVFQCLIASVRPLRVEELVETLALRFGQAASPKSKKGQYPKDPEDAAFSACSNLVTVVGAEDSQIVQFSHFTVKQFLTLSHYHISPEPAHTILAQACLTTLLQLTDKVDDQRIISPLLSLYAAQYWVIHSQFGPHFRAWIRIHDLDQERAQTADSLTERSWQPPVTPLYYAVLCGLPSLVINLITTRPQDINARCGHHGTPLHAALQRKNLGIAELLLAHGADVDARDKCNWRPLEKVLDDDHIEALRLLLKYKVYVNAWDQWHWTPLRRASANGHLEVVRLLLQNGAQVNAGDPLGWTPLHLAAFNGHVEVAQLLLENAANVNAQTKGDFTPLYVASSRGLIDVVKVLLRFGADVRLRGIGNQSPLRVAFTQQQFKVAQLLSGNMEGW
ncbi:ankyrin repeat-containing domain protein [Russula brevipes]|nr:ankyrin repeat-containing domain protein [Russula brevipes]